MSTWRRRERGTDIDSVILSNARRHVYRERERETDVENALRHF